MRYAYMALVAVLAALMVLFMAQNLQSVTVALFAVSLAMPVWVLVLIISVVAMFILFLANRLSPRQAA